MHTVPSNECAMTKNLIIVKPVTQCTLRKISSDIVSTFEKLLIKDNSVTIHVRNLKKFATELYKTIEDLAVPIMHKVLEKGNIKYYPCLQTDFQLGSVKTVSCSLRALRYLGPKIQNVKNLAVKNPETLEQFQIKPKALSL